MPRAELVQRLNLAFGQDFGDDLLDPTALAMASAARRLSPVTMRISSPASQRLDSLPRAGAMGSATTINAASLPSMAA